MRLSVMLAAVFLGFPAAERYVSVGVGPDGRVTVVTEDGRRMTPPNDNEQVGADQAEVAPDHASVCWRALYTNCCTSYPLPRCLKLFVDGELHTLKGTGLPVWQWQYQDGGRLVAFREETPHGGQGEHYELWDVRTVRRIAEYTPTYDTDGHTIARPNVPTWVAVLDARGGQAAFTVDDALKNLTDSNPKARWQAARALREMGERAEASVPALVQTIEADASVDVQVEAILALGAIGKGRPTAVAALTDLLPRLGPVLKGYAVIALGDSGSGASDAVPALVKFLESATDSEPVILSIIALGRIGPSARQAVSVIEKHLNDTHHVGEWGSVAVEARKAIDPIQRNDRRH